MGNKKLSQSAIPGLKAIGVTDYNIFHPLKEIRERETHTQPAGNAREKYNELVICRGTRAHVKSAAS